MADGISDSRRQYWRERRERADWSPDFRRDIIIAMLVGAVSWWLVHGRNAWENVWVPVLAAFVGVAIYECVTYSWRFFVTVPRDMHYEVRDSAAKIELERDEALAKLRNDAQTSLPGTGRLSIISAHWGISRDVYTDVTEIVRAHAKPDSANIPASIGLFGDPYPGPLKRLTVEYSVTHKWNLSVDEYQELVLPEKYGEEQSNAHRARKALDAMVARQGACDVILGSGISEPEYKVLMHVRTCFMSLQWSERIALKRLCDAGTMPYKDLVMRLSSDGFKDSTLIVGQLLSLDLAEQASVGNMITLKHAKWMDALLKDNPPC